MRVSLVVFILLILVTGCAGAELDQQRDIKDAAPVIVQTSITPSRLPPSVTPSPTIMVTATATPAPTYTATPTPTAVPITVIGNPRAVVIHAPGTQDGALCGLVDLFDFPLEPPHADDRARGGSDFGIYRRRYDKFHAGEDWWLSNWRSTLGEPVFSVGHGRVTYAEPTGWGRDQGVIIVRHFFEDGREILSFYGHLDPESFEVKAGDCVERGELLGEIGMPKTGPHLHFEMRTHMPLETGTGYWFEDPTLAGWVPPSATIWESRMAVSPGVRWTHSFANEGFRTLGTLGNDLFIYLDGNVVVGLDSIDGSERYRFSLGDDVEHVLLNSEDKHVYSVNQFGVISAYALPGENSLLEIEESALLWMADLNKVGIPELLPLPGGGLLLSWREQLFAISADGRQLWEGDLEAHPFDWLTNGDELIISVVNGEGSLWSATGEGLSQWEGNAGGYLTAAEDNLLLYDGSTLFQLDSVSKGVKPLITIPGGSLQLGDVAAYSNGGAVITHADPYDRRILSLDNHGTVLWERSLTDLGDGRLGLFADQDQLFLVPKSSRSSISEVSIYAVDLEGAWLTHLFTGGTRSTRVDQTSLHKVGNGQFLINIDGQSLTAIDSRKAEQMVSAVANSSR